MSLFADDCYREGCFAPEGKIKGEPAENRHHDVHHLRWNPREVENCDRFAIHRDAEDVRENLAELVAEVEPATKDKSIARIALESEYPSFNALVGGDAVGAIETSHCYIKVPKHIRHAIGCRRIHRSKLVDTSFREIGLLTGQHRFAKYF